MSLKYGILGLISIKPLTGYDLKGVFDNSINFFWQAKQSQIYRELSKLTDEGYVKYKVEHQESRPDKKVYMITPLGEDAFKEWLNGFSDTVKSKVRDGFLLRIYFGSKISTEELIFQFRKYIKEKEKTSKILEELYNNLNQPSSDLNCEEERIYKIMTIRKGLLSSEASIKWALECIEKLLEKNI